MERNVSGCDCNVIHPEIVEAVGKQMGKREEIEKLASFFKVLGDETRVRILWALDIHSVCVCDLSNILGMTKSAISHQLAALKRVGLVRSENEEAVEKAFPYFKTAFDAIGRTRGWPPMSREHFLQEVKQGSMYVGSPETVAQKIAATMRTLDANRFDLVYGFGPVPASERLRTVELYAKEVIPRVKQLLSKAGDDEK